MRDTSMGGRFLRFGAALIPAIAGSVVLLLVLGWVAGLVPAATGFAIGVAGRNIAQARHLGRTIGVISHL